MTTRVDINVTLLVCVGWYKDCQCRPVLSLHIVNKI